MPWTIYRYIFKEMLKLLVTSSVVLVLVISFAAAIKPLSEGLLDAQTLARYVFYTAPTMLGFILPFSGAFASTLVFSRMVADNELLVCRAGGISYRSVLLPVVFLGLGLTLSVFYLSNWVVPSFYRQATHMLEKDIMQVIVNQVERSRPVKLGNLVLYADAVDDSHPPPTIPGNTIQPVKLIRLRGVALGQLDTQQRLRSDSTAEKADILLYRVRDHTWATVQLENVVYYDAAKGDMFSIEKWTLPQMLLPSPIKDDPRFLSWPEMRALGDQPELYDSIREEKYKLAEAVAQEQLLEQIQTLLTEPHPGDQTVRLPGVNNAESFRLTSPSVTRQADGLKLSAKAAAPVRVEYLTGGKVTRRIEAQSGKLWIEASDPQPEPRIRIKLVEAKLYGLGTERHSTEHATITIPPCRWPSPVMAPLKELGSSQLLKHARQAHPNAPGVEKADRNLRGQIIYLFRHIVAQLNERASLAVACLLLLVLGAVLSMKLGQGMPLVIYFWSFLSAITVVVICHSGENIATHPDNSRAVGLLVIWLGNIFLITAIGGTYLVLSRN